MNFAFGVVIFPLSWRLGFWRRAKKDILSIGPIRFVLYKQPGEWKPAPDGRYPLGLSDEDRLDNEHSRRRGDVWAALSSDPATRSLQEANIALSKRVNRLSDERRRAES